MGSFNKKMWVKFNGSDIECFCEDYNNECIKNNPGCKEYVVKFIEIERNAKVDALDSKIVEMNRASNRFKSEVSKVVRKMKKIRM